MKRALPGGAAVFLALLATGCAGASKRSEPKSLLERGLFFEERSVTGRSEPISAMPGDEGGSAPVGGGRVVVRNATGATVDVNSTVRIELLRDELGVPSQLDPSRSMLERATGLRDAVRIFGELQACELRAAESWKRLTPGSPEYERELQEFTRARRDHGLRASEFYGTLRDLWPRDHPRRLEQGGLEDLVDGLERGDGQAARSFQALLAERIEELAPRIEQELLGFEEVVRAEIERRQLVIEAFLVPREDPKEAHAVHVEGYDDLHAESVTRIDGNGLALTESERSYLLDLMAASKELAEALEKVRRGEATLAEAFAAAKTEIGRKIAARLEEFERLRGDLSTEQLGALRDETKAAFEALLTQWGARLRDRLAQEPADSLAAFPAWASALERVRSLVEDVQELRERWRQPQAADLPQLLLDSHATTAEIAAFVQELVAGDQASELARDLEAFMADPASALTAEERRAFEDDLRPLKEALGKWRQLAQDVKAQLTGVVAILSGPPAPADLELANPRAFRVDLDLAPDAEIDLQTTTRKAGDYLVVRARLLDDQQTVATLRSTLRLEKLGWHADLVPSIVYVTADRVSREDDSGGFSASLGWMWSYGPRDDEGDTYLSRALGWSAGLHAVFLSFAPDNDAEIGLGAALGLWDGRLQFGTGYNLFAEDAGDGRWYYYVGSSLIPLLQALSSDSD